MTRSNAWFARQLAHARECIAQADRHHTSEELRDARTALLTAPQRAPDLFTAPPHAGVMTGGQPETPRLAASGISE